LFPIGFGDFDPAADFVERLQGLVYSIPRRYRLDDDDAADVFMTSFQTLHRNLDRIESGKALPRWIATTAARECLRLARIKAKTTTDLPLEEIVANEEESAEAEAFRSADAMHVRRVLGEMAPKCRDLLRLLYVDEDTPYSEIATRLGIALGAIGPTRARCLEKLRKLMEADGFFG